MANNVGFGDERHVQDDFASTQFMIDQAFAGKATCTLVEVVAVEDETVDVRPLVDQVDGRGTGTPHGVIHDLPFFTLRAGNCEIRVKPRVGDKGAAVFCHSDISQVKATKRDALPGSKRRFDWADGLYFGGFLPSGPATTVIEINADDNVLIKAPTVKVEAATVRVAGDLAVDGAVTVAGAITAAGEVTGNGKALSTHTHGSVQTGTGTSGPPT